MSRTGYDRLRDEDEDPDGSSSETESVVEETLNLVDGSVLEAPSRHAATRPVVVIPPTVTKEKNKTVSWGELPRKKQLFVITMARLSEPLVQTSLQVAHSGVQCS
jgi:hypothetical protein